MTPGIFGTAIYQINFSVSRLLAFSLDDASATYLYTVNRLMEFPIGVFAVAVSTVVYPLIAAHAVKKDFAAMAGDFQKGIRLILIINVPAAVGLALLSGPIVRLIYQHGHVTHDDAAPAWALLLSIMVIGPPFLLGRQPDGAGLLRREGHADPGAGGDGRLRGQHHDQPAADPLAGSPRHRAREHGGDHRPGASSSDRALVRRLPQMHFGPLVPSIAKVLGGTAVMAAVVAGGWRAIAALGLGSRAADAAAVAVAHPGRGRRVRLHPLEAADRGPRGARGHALAHAGSRQAISRLPLTNGAAATRCVSKPMTPISTDSITDALHWRYATKKFDPARKIPAATWAALEQALVLAPSTYGLQPWKFVVVETPAVKEKLSAASHGQRQPADCSHLVVFSVRKDLGAGRRRPLHRQDRRGPRCPARESEGIRGPA